MRAFERSIAVASLALGLTLGTAGATQAAPAPLSQAMVSTSQTGAASAAVSHAGPDIYYTGTRRNPDTIQLHFPNGTLLSINTSHRRQFRHAYRLSKRVGQYRARVYYKLRVPVGDGHRIEVRMWFRNLRGHDKWHAVTRRLDLPPSATVYHP